MRNGDKSRKRALFGIPFRLCTMLGLTLGNFFLPANAQTIIAYITNSASNTVSVIDTATNRTTATITGVGAAPWYLAVTPDGKRVYVLNMDSGTVSVIDAASSNVIATITVPAPWAVAASPDGKHVYVSSILALNGPNTISVIDTTTNTVSATIAVSVAANSIAFTPDGKYAYVPSTSNALSVIDTATNTISSTITVGALPSLIAITPDGKYAYVANQPPNRTCCSALPNAISVINTATGAVSATIAGVTSVVGMVITPDGKHVYLVAEQYNTVWIIDTATNTTATNVVVPGLAYSIAVTPDGKHVYALSEDSSADYLSVIDTATSAVIATISPICLQLCQSQGGGPDLDWEVVISPDGKHAYVPNRGSGTVAVIDTATNTVATTIAVGSGPVQVGFASVQLPPSPLPICNSCRSSQVCCICARGIWTGKECI